MRLFLWNYLEVIWVHAWKNGHGKRCKIQLIKPTKGSSRLKVLVAFEALMVRASFRLKRWGCCAEEGNLLFIFKGLSLPAPANGGESFLGPTTGLSRAPSIQLPHLEA